MVNIVPNLQLQDTCSFPYLAYNRLHVRMKIKKIENFKYIYFYNILIRVQCITDTVPKYMTYYYKVTK